MLRNRSKENRGLPLRWRVVRGVYYYQVPPGLEHLWDNKKLFRLGFQLNEAYDLWSARVGANENPDRIKTIGQLLDQGNQNEN